MLYVVGTHQAGVVVRVLMELWEVLQVAGVSHGRPLLVQGCELWKQRTDSKLNNNHQRDRVSNPGAGWALTHWPRRPGRWAVVTTAWPWAGGGGGGRVTTIYLTWGRMVTVDARTQLWRRGRHVPSSYSSMRAVKIDTICCKGRKFIPPRINTLTLSGW